MDTITQRNFSRGPAHFVLNVPANTENETVKSPARGFIAGGTGTASVRPPDNDTAVSFAVNSGQSYAVQVAAVPASNAVPLTLV